MAHEWEKARATYETILAFGRQGKRGSRWSPSTTWRPSSTTRVIHRRSRRSWRRLKDRRGCRPRRGAGGDRVQPSGLHDPLARFRALRPARREGFDLRPSPGAPEPGSAGVGHAGTTGDLRGEVRGGGGSRRGGRSAEPRAGQAPGTADRASLDADGGHGALGLVEGGQQGRRFNVSSISRTSGSSRAGRKKGSRSHGRRGPSPESCPNVSRRWVRGRLAWGFRRSASMRRRLILPERDRAGPQDAKRVVAVVQPRPSRAGS